MPNTRWARAWWMALIQAQERHRTVAHANWGRLWRQLPAFITPNSEIDGKPVLYHLLNLQREAGIPLLNRAFQVWSNDQVVQALPIGAVADPWPTKGPSLWAYDLVRRLIPMAPGGHGESHPISKPLVELVHRLASRSDDRNAQWRTWLWQALRYHDAARAAATPPQWTKLIARLREQGQVEQPLPVPMGQLLPAATGCPSIGHEARCTGTLDLVLFGMLKTQRPLSQTPWTQSPWIPALTFAVEERDGLSGWPEDGAQLTDQLWHLLEQRLSIAQPNESTSAQAAREDWFRRVSVWRQARLLHATADEAVGGEPTLDSVPRPAERRRL